MTINVLLVDDHPVVRSGLRAVLEAADDASGGVDPLKIVAEAATGEEAITLASHLQPDVVLCDLRLGEGINGIETTKALRSLTPAPAVLILTTFDRDAEIIAAIEAGAAGYLLKDAAPAEIIAGIKQVAAGEIFLSPNLASRVFKGMTLSQPRLTNREKEVLKLLVQGASNQDIARALFVGEATVKTHLSHIFTKLEVDSRSRAIVVAQETGLI